MCVCAVTCVSDPAQYSKFSDDALRAKIDELQKKMENEVKEIEERYGNLKKPFLTALSERKGSTPASPQTRPAVLPRSPKK